MNLGGQRQHPRVQLDTAVRVRRGADGPWLHARALDLSEGGVRVQVHEGMPVGSEVRCSLPLLGARGSDLELLGTVAWVEGGAERHDTKTLVRLGAHDSEPALERRSMGLRFSPLPTDDAERVRTAVRGAATRPCDVVLALEGRAEPVTARAEPTAEGLLLRAPLSVVRIGASVGVRFGSDGDSVVGVVKSVSLGTQDGAPELRIELGGRDPNAVQPEEVERPSGSSGALMNPAGEELDEQAPDSEYDPDDTVEVFVPTAVQRGASTTFVVVVALACAGLGIAIGLALAERLPRPLLGSANHVKEQAVQPRPVALPTPPPSLVSPATAQVVEAPSAADPAHPPLAPAAPDEAAAAVPGAAPTVPAVAPTVPAGQAPAAVPTAPNDPLPATPAVATPEAALTAAPSAAASPTAEPAPAEDPEPATGPAGQGLQVSTLGRVTRVRIPIAGSGDGMRVYDLSSPGLTVNLPGASTPLQLGNFAVNTGLARRVWLRKLETGGLQVRVIYSSHGAVRPEVSAENGALTIDLSL